MFVSVYVHTLCKHFIHIFNNSEHIPYVTKKDKLDSFDFEEHVQLQCSSTDLLLLPEFYLLYKPKRLGNNFFF